MQSTFIGMYFAGKADITGPVADINLMVCIVMLLMNEVYLLVM